MKIFKFISISIFIFFFISNNNNYLYYSKGKNLKNIFKKSNSIIYSYEAVYETKKPKEYVTLINEIFKEFVIELIIDKKKIYKTNKYIFPKSGKHHIIAFLNLEKLKYADLMFNNITNLVSINFSNNFFHSNLKSIYGIFKNCINLVNANFNNSFSNIQNFSYSFQNCISLTSIDLSNIVTSEAINISYMFSNCSALQSFNASSFDTVNIKDMSGLFYYCSSLTSIDLKRFNTMSVSSMKFMFAGCSLLSKINLKYLKLSNLNDISYIFLNCFKLTSIELPSFLSENILNKRGMFYGCESLKKKYDVCIIGLWFGTNYGSLSTYYALHQVVKNMGYSILMIDSPIAPLRGSKLSKCHPIEICRKLYNISEQKPLDKLYEFNNICEKFLLGSDQLWKPYISRPYNQFFFLDFVHNSQKKISYGTSFGDLYNVKEKEKILSKKNLKRFNNISVRDELSLNITKKIFGLKKVVQVCDPTFICNFSEYESLINKSKIHINFEYFLAYILDPSEEKGYRLEKLSIDKNITIIIILDQPQNIWEWNKKRLSLKGLGKIIVAEKVDLNDFMYYFSHSKAIFTDSFHGTIFSIIFKKPFVTLRNDLRGGKRFYSLLNPINLTYRLFDNPSCINDAYHLYDSIDYQIPLQKLKNIKTFSYNWLKNALKT